MTETYVRVSPHGKWHILCGSHTEYNDWRRVKCNRHAQWVRDITETLPLPGELCEKCAKKEQK